MMLSSLLLLPRTLYRASWRHVHNCHDLRGSWQCRGRDMWLSRRHYYCYQPCYPRDTRRSGGQRDPRSMAQAAARGRGDTGRAPRPQVSLTVESVGRRQAAGEARSGGTRAARTSICPGRRGPCARRTRWAWSPPGASPPRRPCPR